jgi:predicted nucleic acid-binding Zn ribbon protein
LIYDYKCCEVTYSVVKSMKDGCIDEPCPKCGKIGQRIYSKPLLTIKNFQADFYPSLGKVFEKKSDLQYHLDKNNLVEIGNDFKSAEIMQTKFDRDREIKKEKSWESLDI